VNVVLDNFERICYLADDESFEAEEIFETFNLHAVTLESRYSSFFVLNHCNDQRYALNFTNLIRNQAGKPKKQSTTLAF
jgi:hypothetical protein